MFAIAASECRGAESMGSADWVGGCEVVRRRSTGLWSESSGNEREDRVGVEERRDGVADWVL